MTIFDLLFLGSVLSALGALIAAAVWAMRGRRAHAVSILKRLGAATLAYLALVAIVSAARPQRVRRVGDPWCFDDWCLRVEGVTKDSSPPGVSYHVSLEIFSEAKRVSQRASGAWIYLIDDRGHRYEPAPDSSAVPLDVRLQPGESVKTTRLFAIPADAHVIGLITGHGGAYCTFPGPLIIGEAGCVFGKPDMVRID